MSVCWVPIMVPDAGDHEGRRPLVVTHRIAWRADHVTASGHAVRSPGLAASRSDTLRIVLAFPSRSRNPFHVCLIFAGPPREAIPGASGLY